MWDLTASRSTPAPRRLAVVQRVPARGRGGADTLRPRPQGQPCPQRSARGVFTAAEAASVVVMAEKDRLGKYGEDIAVGHLEAAGMVVLARNWRCADGELDIIAQDGSTLVFCEVKTRSGLGYGSPLEAVVPAKARRIRRLAAAWLRQADRGWPELRFDVVSVLRPRGGQPTVEHLRGAF